MPNPQHSGVRFDFVQALDQKSRKKVLVTGGAGYIGSHTAKALSAAGYCPVVIDNLSTGHKWAVKWSELIEADISDRVAVRRCLAENNFDAVIHFAASAYVGESVKNPYHYFQNNVSHTLAFLGELLNAGVTKIVFSSSCATYGAPVTELIAEDHPQAPLSPYGESKLFIERVLHWFRLVHGLEFVCLRYFNAAGADPDGELGESHTPETHIIPTAIHTALGLRDRVDVYGGDYDTLDGTAIRDYVHVSDLARAHVLALEHLMAAGASTTMNLGTGRGYSVRNIIETIERVSGSSVPFQILDRRPGDAPSLIANPARAREVLDWRPQFSDLDEIVRTAWKWHAADRCAIACA